eukprot:5539986-Pleurochrysis_carterae.AAC.1
MDKLPSMAHKATEEYSPYLSAGANKLRIRPKGHENWWTDAKQNEGNTPICCSLAQAPHHKQSSSSLDCDPTRSTGIVDGVSKLIYDAVRYNYIAP